jgi:hypothetical protein
LESRRLSKAMKKPVFVSLNAGPTLLLAESQPMSFTVVTEMVIITINQLQFVLFIDLAQQYTTYRLA